MRLGPVSTEVGALKCVLSHTAVWSPSPSGWLWRRVGRHAYSRACPPHGF